MSTNTIKGVPVSHPHRVRTFFAGLCGTLALSLVTLSILVVWANRTLTDTTTYVKTVAPLVSKPAVQDFVADRVSDALLQDTQPQDVAQTLLPNAAPGTPDDQLKTQELAIVASSVKQIVSTKQFADLWQSTNQSVHQQLISQLNTNSATLSLDFSPTIHGVIQQLGGTQLAPVADQLELKPDTGKITLKSSAITKVHKAYKLFQVATWALVALTLLLAGAAVWLSVHHIKTLRRILLGTGVLSLLLAVELELPSVIKLKGSDPAAQNAALAIVHVLFRNLQIASLIIGVVCILAAIASKVYERMQNNTPASVKR